MARSRKKAPEPTATEPAAEQARPEAATDAAPAVAIQPEGIATDHLRPEAAERTAAHETGHQPHGHAERHHRPREHGHAREHGPSHAESVGKRAGYSPAGIIDRVAGVRLAEYQDSEKKIYLSVIRFDEKPSDAAMQILRDARFQWRQPQKEWTRPVRFETRAQDRLHAERTFELACEQRRADKGITHSFGGAA